MNTMQVALLAVLAAPVMVLVLFFGADWLRRRKIAPPAKGQIWRSRHSGDRIEIVDVRAYHTGTVIWEYRHAGPRSLPPEMTEEGWGLDSWKRMIDCECRELEPTTEPAAAGV